MSRSICWVSSSRAIGERVVSTHTAQLRNVLSLSKPHGSVARKADCALIGPIRLPIVVMADKRFCSLSPRLVPSER